MSNLSQEFLVELKERLKHLPELEVLKVLSYYSEMIQDRIEDGMDEEVAIKSLGKIDDIVATIEEEIPLSAIVKEKVEKQVKEKSNMSTGSKVLIGALILIGSPIWLSILIAIVAVVFGILFGLWCVYIGLVIAYLSVFAIALLGMFGGLMQLITLDIPQGFAYMGMGVLSLGLFILFLTPVIWFSKKWFALNLLPFKMLKRKLIK